MDASRFEQQFSWLKTYVHELKEIAEMVEQESDFFKGRALQALRAKGPAEARAALEGVRKTIDGMKRKVGELDDAYHSVIRTLEP